MPGLLLSQQLQPGQEEVGVAGSRHQEVLPLPHHLDEVADVDLPGPGAVRGGGGEILVEHQTSVQLHQPARVLGESQTGHVPESQEAKSLSSQEHSWLIIKL